MDERSSKPTNSWSEQQINTYSDPESGFGETHRALQAAGRIRYDAVLAELRSDWKVLDAGCNDGSFTNAMCIRGIDAIGCDFEEVINRAKAVGHCPSERLQDINMESRDDIINFKEQHGEFDAVVALGIIEHVQNDIEFLKNCRAVLRPSGIIILTTPLSMKTVHTDHLRFYPPDSLFKLLKICGFKTLKITPLPSIDDYMIVGGAEECRNMS